MQDAYPMSSRRQAYSGYASTSLVTHGALVTHDSASISSQFIDGISEMAYRIASFQFDLM